jgi:hypothetical protein
MLQASLTKVEPDVGRRLCPQCRRSPSGFALISFAANVRYVDAVRLFVREF